MKILFTLSGVFLFLLSFSQTVVWSDDFATAGSGWTLNITEGTNDAAHNIWVVNSQGPGSSSPSGGNLLHITCNSGDPFCSAMGGPGSVYNAGGITAITTSVLAYSPAINTTGWSNMTLNFWYLSRGQMGVDYGTARYSTDNGATWNAFPDQFANQSNWTQYAVALPSSCENISNLRIGFFWQNNNDATGNDPPFCVDDITITIPSASGPDAIFTASETTICEHDCISFTDASSGSPVSWSWSFPGASPSSSASQQPGIVCYPTSGTFKAYLTVTDASSNTSVDSLTIVVNAATAASFTVSPLQGAVPLSINCISTVPAAQCHWDVAGTLYNGVSQVNHVFLNPGVYQVCLYTSNASGCTDTLCQNVVAGDILLPDTSYIVVPNVFTPNSDQKNDVFSTNSQNIIQWDTKIYNRWGVVVFESDMPDVNWDGNTSGKPTAAGVYYYVINAEGADGKSYELSGSLTLIR